jgi:hypothetical protein
VQRLDHRDAPVQRRHLERRVQPDPLEQRPPRKPARRRERRVPPSGAERYELLADNVRLLPANPLQRAV